MMEACESERSRIFCFSRVDDEAGSGMHLPDTDGSEARLDLRQRLSLDGACQASVRGFAPGFTY